MIREHNIRPHADIELDLMNKKNGNVTFTLRVNAGNIVDYSVTEYIDVRNKYGLSKTRTIIIEELRVSRSA